jgi:hypothetical protein
MEGLLFFRVYPSDGFRFILIPDGNPLHEFPVLDGNPRAAVKNLKILPISIGNHTGRSAIND